MIFISKNLEFLINKVGLNQSSFAEEMDLKPNTVSNWIRGVSNPDFNKIDSIANFFDIKPQDFIYKDLTSPDMNINIKASKGSNQSVQIVDSLSESKVMYSIDTSKGENSLVNENSKLKNENENLKSKVSFLEGQVQLLRELMGK